MSSLILTSPHSDVPSITEKDWHDAVTQVIEDRGPDFQYVAPEVPGEGAPCMYFHEGAPSCLFGAVLDKLGVPQERVEEGESIDTVILYLWENAPSTVVNPSTTAQSCQDFGQRYDLVERKYQESLARNLLFQEG